MTRTDEEEEEELGILCSSWKQLRITLVTLDSLKRLSLERNLKKWGGWVQGPCINSGASQHKEHLPEYLFWKPHENYILNIPRRFRLEILTLSGILVWTTVY